jgi:hypothetical protein
MVHPDCPKALPARVGLAETKAPFAKLEVADRTQTVLIAIQHGLGSGEISSYPDIFRNVTELV